MLDRVGIPKNLGWGYIGVLIFMMGDGLEAGWLTPYLVHLGLSQTAAGNIFTIYGVTLALSSWFSGVFLQSFGPKQSMLLGLLAYLIGAVLFIAVGLHEMNYTVMLVAYFIKGFGYPLFAYSFLTWVIYRSKEEKLATAVGWFWVAYAGGLFVLGAYYSVFAIKAFGEVATLWSAVLWVLVGAFFALMLNKDTLNLNKTASAKETASELLKGITIVKKQPRVALGGIVRIINSIGSYGFPIFLPLHMAKYGINTNTWLSIWGTIFLGNIIFNLVFGVVGDKFGWRNTIIWFGGVGCAVFTLLLFYTPEWTNGSLVLTTIVGFIWGGLLAAYVPIAALIPSIAGKDKGAAMSILNLGAGLSSFIAPALASLLIVPIHAEGVVWVFAGLYIVSSLLTIFITEDRTQIQVEPNGTTAVS